MATLDFWFDFSCPFAYLGSNRVEAFAERLSLDLVPQPMLLGGVFKSLELPANLGASSSPEKARHNLDDMRRLAAVHGVPLTVPPGHPMKTVLALRALIASDPHSWKLIHRIYRAYWQEGRDISSREVVGSLLTELGMDAGAILAKAESEAVKDDLRRRTDRAVEAGVFGAPTFILHREQEESLLFFGQDRMDDIEIALGAVPAALPPAAEHRGELWPVDFYYDYASAYSYVAHARVESMFGRALRLRPFLLGAIFKKVNPNNPGPPLLYASAPKRAFTLEDFRRQARRSGLTARMPSKFPINSMLALRTTLAARDASGAPSGALMSALFDAYWGKDRDISDPAVVTEVATAVGLDGARLVERADSPEIKDALRANTDAALAAGSFGAPTFVVHPEGRPPALFWGSDRLELAARASRGDTRLL
jgi:2-hydroxychromene-2-carboxylate isomerase